MTYASQFDHEDGTPDIATGNTDAAAARRTSRPPYRTAVDARRLAAALLGCPLVRGLHAGPLGTIATPSEAGPIQGVVISPAMILVGIVAGPHTDRDHLARRIRARLSRLVPDVPVTLSISADATGI